MIRHRSIVLTALLLPTISTVAHAQTSLIGFQTPSRNIACQFYDENGRAMLRCDIRETETQPKRPADCELEWGHSFEMGAKGEAGRICAGDTVYDPGLTVLGYDEVWQRAGFTCRSEETGLTCFNAMQHGFSLSRAVQKIY
jgi:hypothetical protein